MLKININKVVKGKMKTNTNMFFQNTARFIGNINFGREASVNELISFYVIKATLLKLDDDTEEIGNAYLSVAILLAFIERISTPLPKPSSIDEILKNEDFNIEDKIVECTGFLAKSMFEGNEDCADECLVCMAVLVKQLLQEDYGDNPDDCSEPDDSDEPDTLSESEKAKLTEHRLKANEEPIPKEWATPV